MCSIMAWRRHFWTVVTYDDRIWIGGVDRGLCQYVGDEFVATGRFKGHPIEPVLHVYGIVTRGEEEAMALDE